MTCDQHSPRPKSLCSSRFAALPCCILYCADDPFSTVLARHTLLIQSVLVVIPTPLTPINVHSSPFVDLCFTRIFESKPVLWPTRRLVGTATTHGGKAHFLALSLHIIHAQQISLESGPCIITRKGHSTVESVEVELRLQRKSISPSDINHPIASDQNEQRDCRRKVNTRCRSPERRERRNRARLVSPRYCVSTQQAPFARVPSDKMHSLSKDALQNTGENIHS